MQPPYQTPYPPASAPYPPGPPGGYPPQPQYPPGPQPSAYYPQPGLPSPTYAMMPPQQVMQSPGGTTTVVVVEQPAVLYTNFGSLPARTVCPHCRADVSTRVEKAPGNAAWLTCILLTVIGCWPCACVPFCVDGMQDATHSCPNCNFVIRKVSAFDNY